MSQQAYAYYPGCSAHSTAQEYDVSARRVCKELGIELREIEDWTCCGASYAHTASHLLGLALPARNLALAAAQGLPVTTPCAACLVRLKTTADELRNPRTRKAVNEVLDHDAPAGAVVEPLLGVLAQAADIPVRRSLKGLRVSSYYGCLLVRPHAVSGFDDLENPQIMDRLVERVGATAVDWGLKTECCGAGLAIPRPELVEQLAHRLLGTAMRAGADCIVTACPLCQNNLDLRQQQIAARFGERIHLPVLFISQLVGLALGLSPEELLLQKLVTHPGPAMEKIFRQAVAT